MGDTMLAEVLVGPARASFQLTFTASLYLTAVTTNVSAGVSCGVTRNVQ